MIGAVIVHFWVAAKASGLLMRGRVKAALDRVTGVVLIGLGVRLALERR